MKAEEDKANTSDGMNDSAVEADPKEAVDAPAPAAPTKAQEGKNLKDFKFGGVFLDQMSLVAHRFGHFEYLLLFSSGRRN